MPFAAHRCKTPSMRHCASAATSSPSGFHRAGSPRKAGSELPGSVGLPAPDTSSSPAVGAVAGGTLPKVASPGDDGPVTMVASHPAILTSITRRARPDAPSLADDGFFGPRLPDTRPQPKRPQPIKD